MRSDIVTKINNIPYLKGKIRYVRATVSRSKKVLTLYFNSSAAEPTEVYESISDIVRPYLPASLSNVSVDITKIVTVEEFVKTAVVKFLKDKHHIACAGIEEKDVSVKLGNPVLVNLSLETTVYEFFIGRGIGDEVKEKLETLFVDDFFVDATDAGRAAVNAEKLRYIPTEREREQVVRRTLKVDEVARLFDDDATDTATYIADSGDLLGPVYLAGVITNITERMTKTDKPYYLIEFNDRTGSVSGTVFPTKDKLPKIKKLAVGSEIIINGEFQMRGEYRNLRINAINLCSFPKNFVPKERPKKPVPSEYSLIKPQKMVIENQTNFLEDKSAPECFKGRTFVVFDFETTGTDLDDKITEVGAVKMVDGKVVSYFSSLINPGKHIPNEVQSLTGITDEMVSSAPPFEDVCADFYKYCYGATLVAHNIEFDSRFLKKQSKPLDYIYDNPMMDTLAIAREVVYGVANYKLNTLCDKFEIPLVHHRAYNDAYATAQLFIEIIRLKGSLPF